VRRAIFNNIHNASPLNQKKRPKETERTGGALHAKGNNDHKALNQTQQSTKTAFPSQKQGNSSITQKQNKPAILQKERENT
jgi:hypothetical protein